MKPVFIMILKVLMGLAGTVFFIGGVQIAWSSVQMMSETGLASKGLIRGAIGLGILMVGGSLLQRAFERKRRW